MLVESIFKANDVRGVVGTEWDVRGVRAVARATVEGFGLGPGQRLVVGRDMRVSGPQFHAAFVDEVAAAGVDVLDVGLTSTDELWFGSGSLALPGVQFTASHNPAEYNGLKFCLPGARPVPADFLTMLRDRSLVLDAEGDAEGAGGSDPAARGSVTPHDLLGAYVDHLHTLVPLTGLRRRLRVVVDAGNGMGGLTAPAVLERADVELIGLFLDLDGRFPHHQPNPLELDNLRDAQAAVREHDADLALVFDGDADRVFVIDERGEIVDPSAVTALIAAQELEREPGATVVVNTITSRTVAEVVAEQGGATVVSPVGHTYVKAAMAEHDAIFGGEHSAHYYFREFWRADTGMLAALHVLAMLGRSEEPLSALAGRFARYVQSGELNSTVADADAVMAAVAQRWAGRGTIVTGDGVLVSGTGATGDWWFNLRPSNTEPLLRLNVEAKDADTMARLRDEVLDQVRS